MSRKITLSDEQNYFIARAMTGRNVLVDACIGSGKTTAIQELCNALPSDKNILYLTYNKLLKLEAKDRIKNKNVYVTNYHGYAWWMLNRQGIRAGQSDSIQRFLKFAPPTDPVDVMILDEYQDIDLEISKELLFIKKRNPGLQIVAVGDMQQKIYDRTTLNPADFIGELLGDFESLTFTKCFRLGSEHAAMLGRVWNKEIHGVNTDFKIKEMTSVQALDYLSELEPKDFLCLGSYNGQMQHVLNALEEAWPEKFNKRTVYASIREEDRRVGPKKDAAVFTTYDASKGMERDVCVVFDFTLPYWILRTGKAGVKYHIMRNVFCVAASRGKREIIFVNSGSEKLLSEEDLSKPTETETKQPNMNISEMFYFKYKEDVEECYDLLDVKDISPEDRSVISPKMHDAMIDLSPCVGIWQEAAFFEYYDIDHDIDMYLDTHDDVPHWKQKKAYTAKTVDEKVLLMTSFDTKQDRYTTQVEIPFIDEETGEAIITRLGSVFTGKESVQVNVSKMIKKDGSKDESFTVSGDMDVLKDGVVYELKFVQELQHEHFLQCAAYMLFSGKKKGVIWNTRDNSMYEITIPDEGTFKQHVIKTITKHAYPIPEEDES